jgi:hypothetical protein
MQFREFEERDVHQAAALFSRLREERAEVSFRDYTEEERIRAWLGDENILVYAAFEGDKLVGVFKSKRGEKDDEDRSHSAFLTCATDFIWA